MSIIRVVHVITGLTRGGAETMLVKLLETTDKARFLHTVVVLLDRGTVAEHIERTGVKVIALHMTHAWQMPLAIWKLRRLLLKLKPHIVQTWLYHADLVGTFATRALVSVPLVWNVRCSDMAAGTQKWSTRVLSRTLGALSGYPDAVISNSEAGRRVHKNIGYKPRRWEIIPNGFDTERFAPSKTHYASFRAELSILPSERLIGLPARFDPMKDHATFLDAAEMVANSHMDVQFVLIGRGLVPENSDVVEQINRRGLGSRVHLLGERSDMHRIMAGLDIATLSSAYGEGFPNVLGEAMSCGVLCVSTNVGDAAILIGQYGLVVPPASPDLLAAAWLDLLELECAKKEALQIEARASIVSRYSLDAVTASYERLYHTLGSSCTCRQVR